MPLERYTFSYGSREHSFFTESDERAYEVASIFFGSLPNGKWLHTLEPRTFRWAVGDFASPRDIPDHPLDCKFVNQHDKVWRLTPVRYNELCAELSRGVMPALSEYGSLVAQDVQDVYTLRDCLLFVKLARL